MSTDGRTLRSFFSLAAGEAVARGLAFLATLFVARRLGPAMYGVIGVASGIMLYLNQIAEAGVELSGVPEVARRRGLGNLDDFVSSTLTFRLVIAVALTIVVALVGLFLFPQPDGGVLALYVLGLVFVAVGSRWVYLGMQRASRVAVARIGGELAALGLVVFALRDVGDIAIVPIAALLGGAVASIVMLTGLRQFGIRPRLNPDREPSRELLRRSPHLVGFTLLGLVLFNADLLYLRFVSGQAAAGYYAAAYTFIAFAANLAVVWSQSVLPSLARLEVSDPRRNEVYQTSMLLSYAVALPVAVGGILTAGPLVHLVFGADFAPSVPALIWLLPAVPVAAVREIAVVGLIGSVGGERPLIRINAICTVFNLAILLPVVPRYGLVGAAVVTVLTEILRLLIALGFARQNGYKSPALSRFVKPTVASLLMVPALLWAGDSSFFVLVAVGLAIYAMALLVTGVLRYQRPFQFRLVV